MKKYNHLLLANKVCVIVGATSLRSIGYATAELFAAHGAKIVLLDVQMNQQIANEISTSIANIMEEKPNILCLKCDITNVNDCEKAIAAAVTEFGTIDCLINCAGVVQSGGILSIHETDFDKIVSINLKGTFNICQSTLRIFSEKQSGVIVNLASLAAQRGGGLVGGAHYAASKGGVISLTRSIAREFAPQNIRANVICPAMIETNMLDTLTEAQIHQVIDTIPLKRLGKPVELAGTCLFLASDLSSFVTGATLDVNGGIHIH
jgi:NAD(P)-dependent dehydrogenase (short-subunit alcohol dehydrogenase family)